MPERHSTQQHYSTPITFASKSLTDTEHRHSNIERETLGILHGLKTFHHYCFAREVHVITDHKPLIAILKEPWQHYHSAYTIFYKKIHQYRVQILYKPRPEIFIVDWLSHHNHKEGKYEPIRDMDIRVYVRQSATDSLECISISQIQYTTVQEEHLQSLKTL